MRWIYYHLLCVYTEGQSQNEYLSSEYVMFVVYNR